MLVHDHVGGHFWLVDRRIAPDYVTAVLAAGTERAIASGDRLDLRHSVDAQRRRREYAAAVVRNTRRCNANNRLRAKALHLSMVDQTPELPLGRPKVSVSISPDNLMIDRPHTARMYDYYLGGKDNYAADRDAADEVLASVPETRIIALAQRAWMHRSVRMVAAAGVTQFLDLGTGIPTEPNLHQVAQAANSAARIVYVDNDPIVLSHAHALMTGTSDGVIAYLDADLARPSAVLTSDEVVSTLDLTQPLAVSIIGILHFFDDARATALISTLLEAVAPGSFLSLNCVTLDHDYDQRMATAAKAYADAGHPLYFRTREEIGQFVAGLDILPPGIVAPLDWRPDDAPELRGDNPAHRPQWAVVARVR